MKEKKCRQCAMMIPKEAKICPHCRQKQGMSSLLKIILIVIGTGFVFAIFIGKTPPPAEKSQAPPEPAPIAITAEQLYAEYDKNEIAADQKYKNKTLVVTGKIRDLGKTIGDMPYVYLATGAFSHQVMVMFPAKVYDDKLATFNRGTTIDVTGKCTGMTLGMVKISIR